MEEFINSLREQLKLGYDNAETYKNSGKMINQFHYNRVCNLLKDHGGEVIIGNGNAHIDKNLKPTVILNPNPKSKVMNEEIFGPIFPVTTFARIEEVVDYITGKEKPLVVSYFGDCDGVNSRVIRECTSSGAFCVNENTMQMVNTDLPFGGVGNSGQGRMNGITGFKQFSNLKSVLIKPSINLYPWTAIFPPYAVGEQDKILKTLPYGHITQATIGRRIIYFFMFILALIIAKRKYS